MRLPFGLLVFLAFATAVAAADGSRDGLLLIRDVAVVDPSAEDAGDLPVRDVWVRGDRFEAVVPPGVRDRSGAATVLDGAGRYLIPGLADAHVHFDFADPEDGTPSQFVREDDEILRRLFVAHGVTFVRSMWGSPRVVALRDRFNGGEVLGPSMVTTGPLLSGVDLPPAKALQSPDDVAAVVAEHERVGYDAFKVHSSPAPSALRLLFRGAEDRGIPVYGHVPFTVPVSQILAEPAVRTVEHLSAFVGAGVREDSASRGKRWPELMRMYAEQDPEKHADLAASAKRSGKWFCPTLVAVRGDALSPAGFGELIGELSSRPVSARVLANWRGGGYERQAYARIGLDLPSLYQAPCDVFAAFARAGVPIIAGTDSPARPGVAGETLHEELGEYVRLGMTPLAAVRAATANVAEAVGQSDEFGRVAEGLRADAVLLDADPTRSITATRGIEAVLLRGRLLRRADLDRLLAEAAAIAERTREKTSPAAGD